MPVVDCKTGTVREHTAEELAAIAATPQPRGPQADPGFVADALSKFVDELISTGTITAAKGAAVKVRLGAWDKP